MKIWLPEELQFLVNGRKPQKICKDTANDKVVIITGATSGVGLETLKQFAENNATIGIVVRNKQKAENVKQMIKESYDVTIDIFIADFSNLDDIRKVSKDIVNHYDKIDVLINSVGIHSTKRILTKDNIEMGFMVNHLSVFLITILLLPKLIKNTHARVIQVNSQGHRFNGLSVKDPNFRRRIYTGLRSYGQSKTAQLYTVYELARMLKNTNVTINAMHPGAVRSNIGQNNGFLYRWWFKHVTMKFLKDPVISGQSIYYLAMDKELNHVSGKFFDLTILEKPAWHAVKIAKKGKKVWDLTTKLTNVDIEYGRDHYDV